LDQNPDTAKGLVNAAALLTLSGRLPHTPFTTNLGVATFLDDNVVWLAKPDDVETNPGGYSAAVETIEDLSRFIPNLPVLIGEGTSEVGVDITPGTYVARHVVNCYWERRDGNGEIIDNNFINAAPTVRVTIRASDAGFNSDSCGTWVKTG